MRTFLSYMVNIGARHGAYDFRGALKGSNLIATVRVKSPTVGPYLDPYEAVTNSALGFCQAVVETHGGAFEVRDFGSEIDATITFTFPVEETTPHGRGIKFSPPAKTSKSRKPTSRSHG